MMISPTHFVWRVLPACLGVLCLHSAHFGRSAEVADAGSSLLGRTRRALRHSERAGRRSGSVREVAKASAGGFFYDYVHHGQDWSDGQCNSRESQSPIDFDKFAPWKCILGNVPPFKCDNGVFHFKYQLMSKQFLLQNNGYSISADFAGQGLGGITHNNGWFNLLSVNFHSKSEHTFHGKHFPLEIHVVHKKYDSGHVLIVAIPIETPPAPSLLEERKGKSTAASSRRLKEKRKQQPEDDVDEPVDETSLYVPTDEHLDELDKDLQVPTYAADEVEINAALTQKVELQKAEARRKPPNPGDPGFNPTLQLFLQESLPGKGVKIEDRLIAGAQDLVTPFLLGGTFFEYKGSLTAPPCAEQVTWFVRREPVQASWEQANRFEDMIYKSNRDYGNYRSVMPLAGRPIYVKTGINDEPAATAEDAPFWDANVTRASDFRPVAVAKDAIVQARHVGQTAKAIDDATLAASSAHANTLPKDEQIPVMEKPPPGPPPPPMPDPEKMIRRLSDAIAQKAREAAWNAAGAALATQSLNLGGPAAGAPGAAAAPAAAPGAAPGPAGVPAAGPAR